MRRLQRRQQQRAAAVASSCEPAKFDLPEIFAAVNPCTDPSEFANECARLLSDCQPLSADSVSATALAAHADMLLHAPADNHPESPARVATMLRVRVAFCCYGR